MIEYKLFREKNINTLQKYNGMCTLLKYLIEYREALELLHNVLVIPRNTESNSIVIWTALNAETISVTTSVETNLPLRNRPHHGPRYNSFSQLTKLVRGSPTIGVSDGSVGSVSASVSENAITNISENDTVFAVVRFTSIQTEWTRRSEKTKKHMKQIMKDWEHPSAASMLHTANIFATCTVLLVPEWIVCGSFHAKRHRRW